MKRILFVITIGVLTTQGCTVSIGPTAVARDTHDHTHAAPGSVSGTGYQGAAGPEGVHGLDGTSGAESPSGQVMGRSSAVVAPQNAHPHANTSTSEPESPFGGKLWAGIIANAAPTVIPMILGAWLK